jgi:outer membrane autotransporter protein
MLGKDWTPADALLVGVALGYSTTDVDANWLGSGDVESYQALLYGEWQSGANYVDGIVGVGFDNYDITRRVDLADSARKLTSDASGTSTAVDLEVGHRYELKNHWRVTPAAGISYERIDRSGFTEKGDPTLALDVDHDSRDSARLRAGARLDMPVEIKNSQITPYVNLFAVQELADHAASISPTLAGNDFRVHAADPGRSSLEATVGVDAQIGKQANAYVDYGADVAESAYAYSIKAGIKIAW